MERFIVGKRISLHAFTASDVTEDSPYASWLNDLTLDYHTERNFFPHSLESLKAFVAEAEASDSTLLLGIYVNESGDHVGNISLKNIDFQHRSAEIAYLLGNKEYAGRGIATEAVRMLTCFGFTKLSLDRIEAGSNAANVGSVRVLEKAGFRQEGVQRGKLLLNNERQDVVLFGALRSEWMAEHGESALQLFIHSPVASL